MTKLLGKTSRKLISIINIFLILFQNIVPLFFITSPVIASTSHHSASVSEVTLAFDSESSKLSLVGRSNAPVDYLLTYSLAGEDSTDNAIAGQAEVNNNSFEESLYLGSCSDEECTPDSFDYGTIVFNNANYEASFKFVNDVLWLTNNGVATVVQVIEDKTYVAPQNNQVSLRFTSLPENPGSLSIEEIILSDEQVEELGALSNVAYDITSSMENGTFEYDLKLPVPENNNLAKVVFAKSLEELGADAKEVETSIESNQVKVEDLNHFTIFVVVDPNAAGNGNPCTVASITGTCYDTLQEAIDNAVNGDTIELASDIVVLQEVNVNTSLTIDGHDFTVTSPFVKTSNSNNSAIGVHTDNVTIQNLTVDGSGGTDLHGINIYVATGILLDNVTAKNYRSGVVVNGSTVTVNNITTSSNSWHGINVDLGSGVTTPAVLTVNGHSSHTDGFHIYSDHFSSDPVSIVDTLSQYTFQDGVNNFDDRLYTHQDIIPPAVPTLTSPADGAYVQPTGLFLDWSDVTDPSGPVTYYYQSSYGSAVGANNALSSVIYSSGVLGSSEINASGSADNRYYWQARACDAAGNCSDWSGPWEVNIDSIAPTAPSLITPLDDSIVNGAVLLSDWTTVSEAHHYIYESYHDAAASNLRWHAEYTASEKTANNVANSTFWWRVKAVDAAGNESDWSDLWKVTIDNDAPATPTGLRRLAKDDHSIVFACGDTAQIQGMHPDWDDNAETDFSHYEYSSFNGTSIGIDERRFDNSIFEYNGSWLPNEGTYGFAVRAVDLAGNKSAWALGGTETLADSCQITYDSTAPITTLTSPSDGDKTNQPITIAGESTDLNTVTQVNLYYSIAGENNWNLITTLDNIGSTEPFIFSYDWTPAVNGAFDLKASGTDIAGNIENSAYVYEVTYDSVSPTITLDSPTQDSVIAGNIGLQATCDEDCDYINFWWRADSESYSNVSPDKRYHYEHTNGTVFNWILDSLNAERWGGDPSYVMTDGDYYFYAAGKDLVGNWARTTGERKITVDNTAPVATIDSIKYSNGTVEPSKFVTNYNTPVILGTATDANPIATVELAVNGHTYAATLTGSDWEATVTDVIPDGFYDMTVTVTDVAGNVTTETQSIRVDTSAPTAVYQQFDGTIEVTGTTAYVNDLSRLSFTGEYSDESPSADLYWDSYVIFEAQDDGSFSFSSNGKQAFCSWRSTPNLVDISGGSTFSLTTPESFTNCEPSLVDGEYYMAHHIYDTATRKDIPSINQFRDVLGLHFIVDTVKPTVSATIDPSSPDGDNGWYISVPTATLAAADDQLLDYIEYHWDSDAWAAYSTPLVATEGTHTLYYRSYDAAGNVSAEGSVVVKYDGTSPNPGPENVRVSSFSLPTADLEWDLASDSISGIRGYDVSWKLKSGGSSYGKNVDAATSKTELNSLTDGEWEIRVKALDEAGNWTETLLLFTIDGASGESGGTTTTSSAPLETIGGAVLGLATGPAGSVLGENVEILETTSEKNGFEAKEGEKESDILGVSSCNPWINYLPLILLAIQALLIIGFGLIRKEPGSIKFIVAGTITLLVIVAYYFFKDGSCYSAGSLLSFVNQWFAAFTISAGFITKSVMGVFTE